MTFQEKTIKAPEAWDKTAQDTVNTACHVRSWEIIDVNEDNLRGKFLYGTIVIDNKNRFKPGDYIFTSDIFKLDLSTGLVQTRNSLYCLVGDGEQLKASALEAYKMKTVGQSLHLIQGIERNIGPIVGKIN
jgi:hypothetical protein